MVLIITLCVDIDEITVPNFLNDQLLTGGGRRHVERTARDELEH